MVFLDSTYAKVHEHEERSIKKRLRVSRNAKD